MHFHAKIQQFPYKLKVFASQGPLTGTPSYSHAQCHSAVLQILLSVNMDY